MISVATVIKNIKEKKSFAEEISALDYVGEHCVLSLQVSSETIALSVLYNAHAGSYIHWTGDRLYMGDSVDECISEFKDFVRNGHDLHTGSWTGDYVDYQTIFWGEPLTKLAG